MMSILTHRASTRDLLHRIIVRATESVSGAHKNEIKKGQVALAEAKKERKDTLEKIKAREAQVKKLEASKEDSDRLVQVKTQEVMQRGPSLNVFDELDVRVFL